MLGISKSCSILPKERFNSLQNWQSAIHCKICIGIMMDFALVGDRAWQTA